MVEIHLPVLVDICLTMEIYMSHRLCYSHREDTYVPAMHEIEYFVLTLLFFTSIMR